MKEKSIDHLAESILESITLTLAVIDEEGYIIAVNNAWKDFSIVNNGGKKYTNGVGANYLSVCERATAAGDKYAKKALNGIKAVISGELMEFKMEYPCHSPKKERWFSMSVNQLVNSMKGAVILHENITNYKKEQEEHLGKLLESEKKAQILLDHSPILIWEEDFSQVKSYFDKLKKVGVTDFRSYFENKPKVVEKLASLIRFTRVNQTSLEFYGVNSIDELIPNIGDWFVDDSWELFREELIALAEGSSTFEGEVSVLSPSGELKHLFLYLSVPPQYMDTLEFVLVSFLDITKRKESEKILKEQEKTIREHSGELELKVAERTRELAESESKLKIAQSIAKIGYWEFDVIANKLEFSDELSDIFEIKRQVIDSFEDLFSYLNPDDLPKVKDTFNVILKSGKPLPLNYRIITPGGNQKYIFSLNHHADVDDEGNVKKIVGIIQDVTTQIKAKNMQSLVEAVLHGQESERERIAADLHDSINPLLSIANLNIESALEHIEENRNLSKEKIKTAISILENAIRGVKDISNNLSPAVLKNFGLERAIGQLCSRVRGTGQLKVEYFTHGMEDRLDSRIELALFRIAQELFNNILKHAEADRVELQLIRHASSLLMMIGDDGKGFDIPIEKLKAKGFGLNNVTSRVQSLKGRLDIDSVKGKGTTVTIELPM